MSIPDSQLETWSNPGADDSATKTYNRVKNVMEDDNSIPNQKDKNFEVYLQGSYRNSTNIYADSDVDLVVQLNSSFRRNLSRLNSTQKSRYKDSFSSASYGLSDFHQDVVDTLRDHYGRSSVSVEDRALVLDSDSLPLPADIVVCQQYRRYNRFQSYSDQDYDEGIRFKDQSTGEEIISYPKIHYQNGADKNQSVHSRYRETIRIIKNARSYLVEKDEIEEGLAPSYCIECLLYNVPSDEYTNDLQERYRNVVDWLVEARIDEFDCQNEIQALFGSKSTQWSTSDADEFIRKLVDLWNNWYDY
ncbi:nucleotidyltransferase domain-containing protein [Salinirussus salinus]|uniref:nucleotidyltransferase domain-containing protein n=1 Tax=Salinirussus salinus TaxID=1198300 RepID=UPI00135C0E0D|nr:nucleotidyltransferase [Salinirussus salinus]